MYSTSTIIKIVAFTCALFLFGCADDADAPQDENADLGGIIECEFTDTNYDWSDEMTDGQSFDGWAESFTGLYSNAMIDERPVTLTLAKDAGNIVHRQSEQCGTLWEIPLLLQIEEDEASRELSLTGTLDDHAGAELLAMAYFDAPDALAPFVAVPALDENEQLSDLQVALMINENSEPHVKVHMRVETTHGSGPDGTVSLENVLLSEFVFGVRQ